MLTEASWLWAGDHPYERLMSFLRALGPCWNLQRTTWHSQAGSLLLPPQAPLAQSRLLGHMLSCVGWAMPAGNPFILWQAEVPAQWFWLALWSELTRAAEGSCAKVTVVTSGLLWELQASPETQEISASRHSSLGKQDQWQAQDLQSLK